MPGCRDRPAGDGASGAGLAELLLVIACGTVLAAAAVPNVHRLVQEWSLRGGVQTLETSLLWGRMHCISTNSSLMLVVEDGGRSFHWADPTSGARYGYTARFLPSRVRIAAAPRRPLRFYPHGNAAPAGTYVIEGDRGAFRVVVNVAGRIRIQRL
jgi:Tfp pilus assembly protein FimT